jgi:SAM-dependent methyltransferase
MSSSVNRPFRPDEVEDYERRRYRGLDQRIVHSREMRILDSVFRRIAVSRPFAVLDAPCGYGRFSEFLLGRSTSLASCDLSAAMVERAASRSAGPNSPRGVVADLKQDLPFVSRAFDAVFSLRFFHHLHQSEDRLNVLGEFRRVSSRWAVVSFYRLNPLHRFQRWLRHGIKRTRTRIKMIPGNEFEREAVQAGWRVVRIYPLLRGVHSQHIALLERT